VASSPHSTGEGIPDGAICFAIVLNMSPMNPAGVQLAMAIIPPGRHTRVSSAATKSGRDANIAPIKLDDYVKLGIVIRQSFGIALFKGDVKSAAAARARAFSIQLVAMSQPVTSAPARAAIRASCPAPQPTSSRRVPGVTPSRRKKLLRVLLHKA